MELIEIILKDETKIYTYDQLEESTAFLKTLNSPVVLDLHGVLDTLSSTTKLPINTISCCSYVGAKGPMRAEAVLEIKERILTGQIAFGVLVFKRSGDIGTRSYDQPLLGSKAWYCLLVGATLFVMILLITLIM